MANEIPAWAMEAAKQVYSLVVDDDVETGDELEWDELTEAFQSELARIIAEARQQQLADWKKDHREMAKDYASDTEFYLDEIARLKAEHQQQIAAAEEAGFKAATSQLSDELEAEMNAEYAKYSGLGALARHDAKLREEWEKEQRCKT